MSMAPYVFMSLCSGPMVHSDMVTSPRRAYHTAHAVRQHRIASAKQHAAEEKKIKTDMGQGS